MLRLFAFECVFIWNRTNYTHFSLVSVQFFHFFKFSTLVFAVFNFAESAECISCAYAIIGASASAGEYKEYIMCIIWVVKKKSNSIVSERVFFMVQRGEQKYMQ